MLFVEFALMARLVFPMVDVVVHEDVAGAGCGGGVAGSPWKNVEVPYTPIGCERARQGDIFAERTGGGNHLAGVTQTLIEPGPVVSGHVPLAAHHVVDVLA